MSVLDFAHVERDLLSRQRVAARPTSMDGAARVMERNKWMAQGYLGRPSWAHGPVMRLALMDWSNTAGSLVACWLNGGTLPRLDIARDVDELNRACRGAPSRQEER